LGADAFAVKATEPQAYFIVSLPAAASAVTAGAFTSAFSVVPSGFANSMRRTTNWGRPVKSTSTPS
jgi:hypothetical protein